MVFEIIWNQYYGIGLSENLKKLVCGTVVVHQIKTFNNMQTYILLSDPDSFM